MFFNYDADNYVTSKHTTLFEAIIEHMNNPETHMIVEGSKVYLMGSVLHYSFWEILTAEQLKECKEHGYHMGE